MKKKPEAHENLERWMVSYADFMTLLFALFVVLYSFAMTKQTEAVSMAESLSEVFGEYRLIKNQAGVLMVPQSVAEEISEQLDEMKRAPTRETVMDGGIIMDFQVTPNITDSSPLDEDTQASSSSTMDGDGAADSSASSGLLFVSQDPTTTTRMPHSNDPNQGGMTGDGGFSSGEADQGVSQGGRDDSEADALGAGRNGHPFDTLKHAISTTIYEMGQQENVEIEENPHFLTININSGLFFAEGSASILASSRPLITKIAVLLEPINNYVRIRGYTDDQFVNNGIFANSWELSARRAVNVLREFQDLGIAPERLAAEAYGQYSPAFDNETAAGRARNRRVAIAISRYAVQREEPAYVDENDLPEEKPSSEDSEHTSGQKDLNIVRGEDSSIQLNFLVE